VLGDLFGSIIADIVVGSMLGGGTVTLMSKTCALIGRDANLDGR